MAAGMVLHTADRFGNRALLIFNCPILFTYAYNYGVRSFVRDVDGTKTLQDRHSVYVEKYLERQKEPYRDFIHFKKAFDSIVSGMMAAGES